MPGARMSGPRIGSLFSGYGGLDQSVMSVLGGSVAWHCENEPAPSKILAHHWPAVPNLGDITQVDWSQVEPVDVITGGSPCQDVSHAGSRKGMRAGTRSGLWASMVDAIDALRPSLVVWENVRGVLSAEADSDLESCAGCVGDRDDGAVLRALGRVLGDLADLGYDTQWHGLRAADIGAPHGRFRVFVVATDARDRAGHRERSRAESRQGSATPTHSPNVGHQWSGPAWSGRPGSADGGWDARPGESDADPDRGELAWQRSTIGRQPAVAWGSYEPAIRRWERVLGRLAPSPTEPNTKGRRRLSPAFVEWMMGLPMGHVTDTAIGISRNDQLKALGNGVVPAQAAAAVRLMLASQQVAA